MNKEILRALSYGMYAIGVKSSEKPSACIVNTVFQITSSPAVIAVSVNLENYTNQIIRQTKKFTVSILSQKTPQTVIGKLGFSSGKDCDKLKDINYDVLDNGLPVINDNICCYLNCEVINQVETSTHTIFIAEVKDGSESFTGIPMTYKYYCEEIKGSSPPNAPTYQQPEVKNTEKTYTCKICSYVYESKELSFESLPASWVCPICSAPKAQFE